MFLMVVGSILHIVVLPWLDLIVWSINCATSLLFTIILSALMLNEKFIVKYDLVCFIFITVGSIIILTLSNQEQQEFEPEQVKKVLTSVQSIIWYIVFIVLCICNFIAIKILRKSTEKFGADAAQWLK